MTSQQQQKSRYEVIDYMVGPTFRTAHVVRLFEIIYEIVSLSEMEAGRSEDEEPKEKSKVSFDSNVSQLAVLMHATLIRPRLSPNFHLVKTIKKSNYRCTAN